MPDTHTLPRGVIPYLIIDGASDAAAFYAKAFGASEVTRLPAPDGKRLMHCHLEVNGGSLMMSDTFPDHGVSPVPNQAMMLQLVLADGESAFKRAVGAGCEVVQPFEKMFWGDRYGQVKDPFGVIWAINEPAAL